ncbi:hypothetical protein [Nocardioides caldifontis]|uniref:hypothetical protein n=1 Tax=Nocardioides caldifontis TaxID=2588938 RepID=UPI0011DF5E43|nr:hypothetical protein [Nocardioides caldifontis]
MTATDVPAASDVTQPGSRSRPIEDILEPDDVALQQRLSVRPTYYWAEASTHPDKDPCPTWCWTRHGDDWAHEVDEAAPMAATHRLEPVPTTVASLYRGVRNQREPSDETPSYVETATVRSYLEQVGQSEPIVKIDLSHYPRGKYVRENRLRLTIADTEDLIAVLTFLVKEARG